MINKAKNWGKYLGEMDWNFIATFRPHYHLKEGTVNRLGKRLIRSSKIRRVFYALESDRNDNHKHLHLILDVKGNIDLKELARLLGTNIKSVGYVDRVRSKSAVSRYVSKHLSQVEVYDLLI
jgi:hypothetical protein